MSDDLLIGYALNALDPAEHAAAEAHLAAHPEDAAKVERVRRALRPLEADRDGYDPPPGLAEATLARLAELVVTDEPAEPLPVPSAFRRAPDEGPLFPGGWRRADALVAACIACLATGLIVAGVGKLRHGRDVAACQNQLRELHAGLDGYASTHNGRYPAVGSPEVPVAGAFAEELARAGQIPPGWPVACPVAAAEPTPGVVPAVGYSYTLGYLGAHGSVVGVRRGDRAGTDGDWVPVAADLPAVVPAGGANPVPVHGRGQNVLYAGGSVRFATTPTVGVNGDDIYRNDAGLVRAGLHRDDASLGRPADYP